MTKEEKKFILSSNRGELKEYFLKNPQKLLKFLEEIRLENISEETVDIIHIFIFLIVAGEFYLKNDNFNEILCKLSKDKNHYEHENIALIFENLYSPKLINCVYNLAIMELDYMEYDEFFNIARKCTYALGYTNTPKAKEKLELLVKNENELIREYAIKQLNRYDFTDKDVEEQYEEQERKIYAKYDDKTIRVYQAYNNKIADEAIKLGTFGEHFSLTRMTWIKPSFLWMMYRCGWAEKENQERVLAIDIKREAFDEIVKNSVISSYKPNLGITEDEWKEKVKNSLVRCQWDPERDIYGKPIGRRSIQLGIRGEAVVKYVNEWIVKITDITDEVKRIKQSIDNGTFKESFLPEEKEYIIR